MTDYLITRYNDKITTSRAAMETAIADATKLYNTACADIIAKWQSDAIEAALELEVAMGARDRHYLNGPAEAVASQTLITDIAGNVVSLHFENNKFGTEPPRHVSNEEYRAEMKEALGHPQAPGVDVCNVGTAE